MFEEIRARAEAATPGQWNYKCAYGFVGISTPIWAIHNKFITETDAIFIAHAREDIPALLAKVDRLTAESQDYKEKWYTSNKAYNAIYADLQTLKAEKEAAVEDLCHMCKGEIDECIGECNPKLCDKCKWRGRSEK